MGFAKESQLGEILVPHLIRTGWEVFEEPELYDNGPRCDLVAKKGDKLWALELKLDPTKKLFDQTQRWDRHVNLASAVTEYKEVNRTRMEQKYSKAGLGLIYIKTTGDILEVLFPVYTLQRDDALFERLVSEQCGDGAAGGQGGYHTRFRATARNLLEYVKNNQGVRLMDALPEIKHHYGGKYSAHQSLESHIRHGVIKGLRAVRRGGLNYLYTDGFGPHGPEQTKTPGE